MCCIVKKTLEIAKYTGNEVIVQVKKNQKPLLRDCQEIFRTTTPDDVSHEPLSKARNRIERCTAEVFLGPNLTDKAWHLVKAVVKISRYIQVYNTKTKTWEKRNETSFYISTIVLSTATFNKAI